MSSSSSSSFPCFPQNPHRFMDVGEPLPHQVVYEPHRSSRRRRWISLAWTSLAVLVILCGLLYVLHLDGRIGNNNNNNNKDDVASSAGGAGNDDDDDGPTTTTEAPSTSQPESSTEAPSSSSAGSTTVRPSTSGLPQGNQPTPTATPSSTPQDLVSPPSPSSPDSTTLVPETISPAPTTRPASTWPPVVPPTMTQSPSSSGQVLTYTGWCSSETPCFACQGECFVDEDCVDGLVCSNSDGYDPNAPPIPGCVGNNLFGIRYCYVPVDPILVHLGDCSEDDPCLLCQGDCDNDEQCAPGLTCFFREDYIPVPGCAGRGYKEKDYCISDDDKSPTLEPTRDPTRMPITTSPPTTASPPPTTPQEDYPELVFSDYCSKVQTCGLCEGWCTDNDHCKTGLLCSERSDESPVPGCSGSGIPGANYCYRPDDADNTEVIPPTPPPSADQILPDPIPTQSTDPVLVNLGDCSSSSPCGLCEGDCDNDDHCEPGLSCFQRSDFESVPGCAGVGDKQKDYCYQLPNALNAFHDCSISQPCGKCQGDCISDADCQNDLVCFRRIDGEPVPGCVSGGSGDIDEANYCHEPLEGGPALYIPGDLTVNENGLKLSTGLTSRIIATTGKPVDYDMGGSSSIPFHTKPDAAAVFGTPSGGWIYVSNSEDDPGGVGAIEFDSNGLVVNYQMIAISTTQNCGGGKTWWNTWLSCEEKKGGKVWETDPYGKKPERVVTLMGTGRFESAAYYRPSSSQPTFYITEDLERGALRRFTPDALAVQLSNQRKDFSELLHSNATGTAKIEYLKLSPKTGNSGTFSWTTDIDAARDDAENYYSFSEGLDIARGIMYVTAKNPKILLELDLERGTWSRSSTESGAFSKQPDQIRRILGDNAKADVLYFCEDGGENSGVHGRDSSGRFYNILDGQYDTETTGLAFSPNLQFMYVSYQENPGIIFEVKRRDGYPFAGTRLDIKYSSVKS